MKQEEFLRELGGALASLSETERARVIDFYREMICDGVENGKDEQELIAGFGAPREIAAQILAESRAGCQEHEVPAVSAAPRREAEAAPRNNSYPARGPVHTVVVDARNTAVEIRQVQSGPVTVRFTPGENDHVEVEERDGVFLFHHTMSVSFFHWRDLFSGPRRIAVEIPVAFSGSIRASSSNARLNAVGLNGLRSLELSTSNGHLTAEDLRCGELRLKTSNGTLDLHNLRGAACTAQTSNGRVTADDCSFPDSLHLHTSNGSVSAQNLESNHIELISSNGSVCAVILGDMREYAVHSHTSNASSTLPPDLAYPEQNKSLTVHTSNARIDVRFVPKRA